MNELKKLLALALTLGLFTVACDDEECGADGGTECDGGMMTIPDAEAPAEPDMEAAPEYRFIFISDYSAPESDNGSGTAGADICSVVAANGDGETATLTVANFSAGEGTSDDHNDPVAAVNVEEECDPGNNAHYVSLGLNGSLSLESDLALAEGSTITVDEFVGSTTESYSIEVCTDAAGEDCLDNSTDVAEGGVGVLTL
ncbi:MAG: hypothetical protein VYD19_08380 [Myxococcota bacterium]|nr:hypothetical protein [Myxococcota bacterium]